MATLKHIVRTVPALFELCTTTLDQWDTPQQSCRLITALRLVDKELCDLVNRLTTELTLVPPVALLDEPTTLQPTTLQLATAHSKFEGIKSLKVKLVALPGNASAMGFLADYLAHSGRMGHLDNVKSLHLQLSCSSDSEAMPLPALHRLFKALPRLEAACLVPDTQGELLPKQQVAHLPMALEGHAHLKHLRVSVEMETADAVAFVRQLARYAPQLTALELPAAPLQLVQELARGFKHLEMLGSAGLGVTEDDADQGGRGLLMDVDRDPGPGMPTLPALKLWCLSSCDPMPLSRWACYLDAMPALTTLATMEAVVDSEDSSMLSICIRISQADAAPGSVPEAVRALRRLLPLVRATPTAFTLHVEEPSAALELLTVARAPPLAVQHATLSLDLLACDCLQLARPQPSRLRREDARGVLAATPWRHVPELATLLPAVAVLRVVVKAPWLDHEDITARYLRMEQILALTTLLLLLARCFPATEVLNVELDGRGLLLPGSVACGVAVSRLVASLAGHAGRPGGPLVALSLQGLEPFDDEHIACQLLLHASGSTLNLW